MQLTFECNTFFMWRNENRQVTNQQKKMNKIK